MFMSEYGITDVCSESSAGLLFMLHLSVFWARFLAGVNCSSVWWKRVAQMYHSWFFKQTLIVAFHILVDFFSLFPSLLL